ncbi:MAG: hypothetical protein ACKV2Q_23710 [Planctomycetaceae bacterium]
MTRIFLTLASASTLLLLTVFGLGLNIGDPRSLESQSLVSWHLMLALTGLVCAALVHALVLTYFMGTGRWIEDVSKAYQLDDHWRLESRRLKYGFLPWMTGSLLLLLITIGFGAAADPAARLGFSGWMGLPASTWHLLVAIATVCANFFANVREFQSLERNGQLIQEVVEKVREMRIARGLPVEGEVLEPRPSGSGSRL